MDVEGAVKSLKTQICRLLKQADVGSDYWPLAGRSADALNRSWRSGDAPSFPPFLQDVLVRRRTWRQGVFEPTVETVKYLFPAPEEDGHWVQPEVNLQESQSPFYQSLIRSGSQVTRRLQMP